MKHIDLDPQSESIKQFVLSLPVDTNGSVLELNGKPVLRVLPAEDQPPVDPAKLRAAILARRDESRSLNEDWESVDREAWEHLSETGD